MRQRQAVVIFGAALAVRLLYWAFFLRHYRPVSDAQHYFEIARNLATGQGFSHIYPGWQIHPTAFRLPLYPLVLSASMRAFGVHLAVAQLTNAAIGALNVVLAGTLASRIAGRRAGLIAAAVLAVYPPLLANDLVPLSESLSFLLLLWLVWFLADHRWVLASVTAGLLVLTYHSAQVLVLLLVPLLLLKVGWRTAVLFGVIVGLVVTPWLVRNQLKLHTPTLVTSNGYNLAAVYSAQAQGTHALFADPVLHPAFSALWQDRVDEVRWEAVLRQQGMAGLKSHPARVFKVFTSNLKQLAELHPKANAFADRLDGRNMRVRNDTMVVFYLVSVLGIIGLWRHRQQLEVRLLGAMALYFTVMAALFVPPARLRGPLDLVCCIGVGLLFARKRAPARHADSDLRGTVQTISMGIQFEAPLSAAELQRRPNK